MNGQIGVMVSRGGGGRIAGHRDVLRDSITKLKSGHALWPMTLDVISITIVGPIGL